MGTVADLLNDCGKALGALKAGQQLNADELGDGLNAFNRLVGASNTSKANIFTETMALYNTAPNQQSYTYGITGEWAATRPQRIVGANFLLPSSPTIRRKLAIWDRAKWESFSFQAIYTYPEGLYCDYAFPLATVYFRPIPDAIYQIETYVWALNAPAASLDTDISAPPGYEDFWLYNLAERVPRLFGLDTVPPDVAELARRSRMAIARMNLKSPRISSADAGAGRAHPDGFNYFSGEPA